VTTCALAGISYHHKIIVHGVDYFSLMEEIDMEELVKG
jgi:hypothetical protein